MKSKSAERPDYEQYTDEELILRLRDGDSAVTDFIMDKYKNLVRSKAKAMYILGADNEDLIQEGMIGLFKAVRDYDTGRDASFYTFAELCITRQIYTAIQASGRQKHIPLNTYISLYSANGDRDTSESELIHTIPAGRGNDPEELVIEKEKLEVLEQIIDSELSIFEKAVLDLYLTGMPYSQIAAVLGKDVKSTDNALTRTKSKIRKEMKMREGKSNI
ncbi:MAG: RNA polymerase sporulation sigma factor SigH [Lachnospiraceae bacterium]|nr:RNA polymerase sporulation sigma factor SigH [Lachnospiraceae bacterium]MDD3660332.1 RNA polymerase sporulation sigma factor SigH [Lachnospiraceae bacterium]